VAQAPVLPRGFELPLKQRLPRIGAIDQVAVEAVWISSRPLSVGTVWSAVIAPVFSFAITGSSSSAKSRTALASCACCALTCSGGVIDSIRSAALRRSV
jgi:hypothetical protein